MSELNAYRIAQLANARIRPIDRPRFGFFGAMASYGEIIKCDDEGGGRVQPNEDAQIAAAFEETRMNLAPDVVLASPAASKRFYLRCRELGVAASRVAINKRLLQYRKNKSAGVTLEPSTADSDARPAPYLYAAEIALVQTSYRYAASADDLLADPEVAEHFVGLAERITPGGRHLDYVTAALYIRKTRSFKKSEHELLRKIQSVRVEPRLKLVGAFDQIEDTDIPEKEGVFLISERVPKERSLFIGSGTNLRSAVHPFQDLQPFFALGNHFWTPNPSETILRVAPMHEFEGITTRRWQFKLIHDRQPVFNVPVQIRPIDDGEAA